MSAIDGSSDFRARMDALIKECAPDDIILWLAALRIVSEAWQAGVERGAQIAIDVTRRIEGAQQ